MESIALIKSNQKDLNNRVKAVKKEIKAGKLKIKNEPAKKINLKRRFPKKLYPAIYIGHIPHGFYEKEMKSYFSQFGKVITAAVARSKKTGKSKGFGFVEFQDSDVAQIAAETMNNYLMYNKILKCSYIPPEQRKSNLRETSESQIRVRKINRTKSFKNRNSAVTNLSSETYKNKVQQKIEKFKKFFEEKGIDFNLKLDNANFMKNNVKKSKSTRSETSKGSKPGGAEEDQFGVLEIDESDSDIHFKTPPQVKKVFKKSLNSSVSSEKKLLGNKKGKKAKIVKQNSAKIVKPQKSVNKVKTNSPKVSLVKAPQKTAEKKKKVQAKGIGQKLEEKNKPKKKPSLAKSLKTKKSEEMKLKSLQKGVAAILKQEKMSKGVSSAMSKIAGKAKSSLAKSKKK